MAIHHRLPGVTALFTTRADGDLRAHPAHLRVLAGRPVRTARQVHGATVADGPLTEADGQLARDPGEAVAVLVADCLPVVVCGPAGVAVLHAGWRGLAAGILEAGVAALGTVEAAVLGPAARGCCYSVGEEVHALLPGGRVGEHHLDLPILARRRLEGAGVCVGAVADLGLCTICDPRFFSHRRDGARAGRQAVIAWRD